MNYFVSLVFFLTLTTGALFAEETKSEAGGEAVVTVPMMEEQTIVPGHGFEFIDCYYLSTGLGLILTGTTDLMLIRYKKIDGPVKYGLAFRTNAGLGAGAAVMAGKMSYNQWDVKKVSKRLKLFKSNLTTERICFWIWGDRQEDRGTFTIADGRHLLNGVGLGILKTAIEWPLFHVGEWVDIEKEIRAQGDYNDK